MRDKTTETLAQRQMRLHLETTCSKVIRNFVHHHRPRCDVTLLVFNYGADDYSNVAYCTSLPMREMIDALLALLARWENAGSARVLHDRETQGWLPDELEIQDYARTIEKSLPEDIGFSLLCGKGERTQYIAKGDREGVAEMLRADLLPGLRKDLERINTINP